ncbi:hypothetical protein ACFWPX_22945 [Nocardia sp. NPDC058518]|uniref:hypothetical protein n=1 Tax=Nocardia sp. NPDC058518 TaxID=3346534 RepID=UPI00366A2973
MSARRTITTVALGVIAALLLSGCLTTEGVATPEGARYRGSLVKSNGKPDPALVIEQSEQDAARRIDPCSVIDLAATSALGTVTYTGPQHSLGDCEVVLADRTGPVIGLSVSMSTMPVFIGPTTTYGTRVGTVPSGGSLCSIAVVYNEQRAFQYFASGIAGSDTCPALRTVVTASVPLLDRPGLRTTPLKDPCSFLDSLYPVDQKFFLVDLNPANCDYSLGERTPNDGNRYVVSTFTMSRTLADTPPSTSRQLRLAGVPANETSSGEDRCAVTAFVGIDKPFTRPGWGGEPETYVEAISVSGHGCATIRDIAVAVIKTYRAA